MSRNTRAPVPLEVTYRRTDGSPAIAGRWSEAPKLARYVESRWLFDEADYRFVLVARPRGKRGAPLTEVLRIHPRQSIEVPARGVPRIVPRPDLV